MEANPFRSRRKLIAARRRAVASLIHRGLSTSEIEDALPRAPFRIVNPSSGRPYSHALVMKDLAWLRALWLEECKLDIEVHRAEQLAQIDELIRASWAAGDRRLVLAAIKVKADLLGTTAPVVVKVERLVQREAKRVAEELGLDPREVLAEAEAILEAHGNGNGRR